MTDKNPIYYSNLIQPDGSIDDAIAKLNSLKSTYLDLTSTIKQHATEVAAELTKVSSATEGGRKATSKSTDEASRLESAQRELAFAISDTGAKVVELKTLTSQANKESKLSAELVHATSTSYDELKAELQLLVADYKKLTKEQALNTTEGQAKLKTILELKTQLAEYDQLMKVNLKTQTESNKATKVQKVVLTELEKAKLKLAKASSAENIELLKLAASTREQVRINKLNAIVSSEAKGSYNSLSAQYSLTKIQLNKLTEEQRLNTAAGKKMVAQSAEIYAQMTRMQEVTGKHTLSVGNYGKAWNGLDVSVSQIVREMPAAAVSMNTFFLGISNNVPIFMDEVNKMRRLNKIAAAEGKAQANIWKSITKSFLGFNTVLVIALTIFSMFGQDIIKFVGDLFKGKKAIDLAADALKNLNEAQLEGRKSAQNDLVRLKLLYGATQDVTKSTKDRTKAVEEIKKEYPDYFKDLSNEAVLAGNASQAYLSLAAAILKSALARAAENKIVENSEKILELEQEAAEKRAKFREKAGSGSTVGIVGFDPISGIDKINSEIASLKASNEKLAGSINIGDLLFGKSEKTGKTPKQQADETLKLLRENTDKAIELIGDEYERRRAEIQTGYDRENNDLAVKLETDKNLTDTGRQAIRDIIIKNEELKNQELLGLDRERLNDIDEFYISYAKVEKETLQNRLDASTEGSKEELDIRLAILKKSMEIEIKENNLLQADLRQSEVDIMKKYQVIIDQESQDFAYKSGMAKLELQQAFDESEFNTIKRTERAKTIFKLQQEKERWSKILELSLSGAKALSKIEIETIKNIIKAIEREIGEGGFTGNDRADIYSLLGLDVDDDVKDAIQETFDRTLDNISQIIDAKVRLAEVAVETANAQVDAAKSVLDSEIEARNNGYAFNVSQAQKDLALARKTQAAALKEKEKAQRAQNAIDTVTQTSSLITASANIWSSFSALGPFGPALAIAALAAMWGSFAAAKVTASQATKAENESYGEGGMEVLEGGSHASGKDIPLGRTKKGKNRRAEGGEALAIINRRNTSKYKNMLPSIVESLNKGVFEKKYAVTHGTEITNVINNTTEINLKDIESDVKDIRKQSMRRTYKDSDGNSVEVYKNLKVVYYAN